MRRYTFFIPDNLKAALEALHVRDGISESEAIRRAIAEFLKARKIPIATKGGPRVKKAR